MRRATGRKPVAAGESRTHALGPPNRWDLLWLTVKCRLGSLGSRLRHERASEECAMNDAILQEISDFCRQSGLAESTFGRRAVNDGKLASRLRNGGRITTETLDRIRGFIASQQGSSEER